MTSSSYSAWRAGQATDSRGHVTSHAWGVCRTRYTREGRQVRQVTEWHDEFTRLAGKAEAEAAAEELNRG